MSNLIIFALVFGGAGFAIFLFFLIKTVVSPKKLRVIQNLIDNKNIKSAIKQAKMLLARNERNVDAHWYLGECYRAENRTGLAVVEYKYITNAGTFTNTATKAKVRRRLAEEYLKLGQIDESQKEYILLSKIEPNNYENYFNIAKLFEERDYADQALKNYMRAISINPKHAETHMRMGKLYFQKQLITEANKAFMTALKYNPGLFACYYYLGKISRAAGDTQTALAQFEKAQRDNNLKQRALLERGNIFVIKGDLPHAITELERALKIGEDDIPVVLAIRYLLARCHEVNKDLMEAIKHWEKIYEKNPKYRDVAEKLALYSNLRSDDKIKDFLTASQSIFQEQSTLIVQSMGLAVQDVFLKNQDLVEIFALEPQSRWRDAKRTTIIARVYRSAEAISYDDIRGLYDSMRKINAMRSICITANKFTKSAIEFAQIRPIDLVDKEELTKLLHSISE